ASSDQKKRSLPYPKGCTGSAGRVDRRSAVSSSNSVDVSPAECAASDSSAADPDSSPATSFITPTAALASSAGSTVKTLPLAAMPHVYPRPARLNRRPVHHPFAQIFDLWLLFGHKSKIIPGRGAGASLLTQSIGCNNVATK